MALSDNEIISTMRSNSEQGFRMLMAEYGKPVYWHIRRLVVSHDDAQDATQETLVRVYRAFPSFRGDSSLKSWIYRIASNEALRQISNRRQEEVSIDSDSTGVEIIATDGYIDFNDKVAVDFQKAILSLPPKQQLTFNLRYYDELSFDEIAKITDSTAASAKVNYHLAKHRIKAYLNANE